MGHPHDVTSGASLAADDAVIKAVAQDLAERLAAAAPLPAMFDGTHTRALMAESFQLPIEEAFRWYWRGVWGVGKE